MRKKEYTAEAEEEEQLKPNKISDGAEPWRSRSVSSDGLGAYPKLLTIIKNSSPLTSAQQALDHVRGLCMPLLRTDQRKRSVNSFRSVKTRSENLISANYVCVGGRGEQMFYDSFLSPATYLEKLISGLSI
uniref:Pentatricopeptide repeat-containing protein n=1 Tax=Steinernema glaseri TaxID=37863 RepID=A0A1I8AAN9_9BILA